MDMDHAGHAVGRPLTADQTELYDPQAQIHALTACPEMQVKHAAESKQLNGKLVWLDFVDDLLGGPDNDLLPDLCFDGTHLAPSYVKYVDKALQKL